MGNGKQGADAGWAVFAKLGGVELLDFLHVAAPSVVGERGNRVPYGLDIGGDGVADLGLDGHDVCLWGRLPEKWFSGSLLCYSESE